MRHRIVSLFYALVCLFPFQVACAQYAKPLSGLSYPSEATIKSPDKSFHSSKQFLFYGLGAVVGGELLVFALRQTNEYISIYDKIYEVKVGEGWKSDMDQITEEWESTHPGGYISGGERYSTKTLRTEYTYPVPYWVPMAIGATFALVSGVCYLHGVKLEKKIELDTIKRDLLLSLVPNGVVLKF